MLVLAPVAPLSQQEAPTTRPMTAWKAEVEGAQVSGLPRVRVQAAVGEEVSGAKEEGFRA